jgi:hypothetical protein
MLTPAPSLPSISLLLSSRSPAHPVQHAPPSPTLPQGPSLLYCSPSSCWSVFHRISALRRLFVKTPKARFVTRAHRPVIASLPVAWLRPYRKPNPEPVSCPRQSTPRCSSSRGQASAIAAFCDTSGSVLKPPDPLCPSTPLIWLGIRPSIENAVILRETARGTKKTTVNPAHTPATATTCGFD